VEIQEIGLQAVQRSAFWGINHLYDSSERRNFAKRSKQHAQMRLS
jgi:hypothetical protein